MAEASGRTAEVGPEGNWRIGLTRNTSKDKPGTPSMVRVSGAIRYDFCHQDIDDATLTGREAIPFLRDRTTFLTTSSELGAAG